MILAVLLSACGLFGQSSSATYWAKALDISDECKIAVDGAGYIYYCDQIEHFLKLDSSGNVLFANELETGNDCMDILYHQGSIYMITLDGYLYNASTSGTLNWVRRIPEAGAGLTLSSLAAFPNGDLLLTLGPGLKLMRLTSTGSIIWQKSYSNLWGGQSRVRNATILGNYIFLAGTNLFELYCLDHDGNHLWSRNIHVSITGTSSPISIAPTAMADEFIVLKEGGSFLRLDIDADNDGAPMEGDLDVQWAFSLSGGGTRDGTALIIRADTEEYIATISSAYGTFDNSLLTLHVSGDGTLLSAENFGHTLAYDLHPNNMILTPSGTLIESIYINPSVRGGIVALDASGRIPNCEYTTPVAPTAVPWSSVFITDTWDPGLIVPTAYTSISAVGTIRTAGNNEEIFCECLPPIAALGPMPASGSTECNPVSVSWFGDPDAASFDVILDGAAVPACTGITASTCALGAVSVGSHTWSVTTHTECGDTAGPAWTFQAHSAAPLPATTLSPLNGASVCSPGTFSWTAAPDALTYDLLVDGLVAAADLSGTASGPVPLTPGGHTWQVVARNGCGSTPGSIWNFTVDAVPFPEAAPEFLPAVSFAAGTSPAAVAAADFNRNGKPDLAVANAGGATISVLEGNGTGGFAAATNHAVGGSPHGILAADFSRDHKIDIATANYADGTVTVLINAGSLTFTAAAGSPFTVGTGPEALATADFNRDGILDLAVTNSGSGTVSILLGTSAPSFGSATHFTTGGADPRGIATADFNTDGRPDLVVANAGNDAAQVLLGDGLGGFSLGAGYGAGTSPRGVAVGDFNLDGHQDFIVANNGSADLDLALGDGTGSFSFGGFFPAGLAAQAVCAGDFNNDGRLDAAIADSSANAAVFLPGTPSGFGTAAAFAAGTAPLGIAAADVNRDGGLDLALASGGDNAVAVLISVMGTGDSLCYSARASFNAGYDSRGVATGDFNFDGNADLAVSNLSGERTAVFFGNGHGGFTKDADLYGPWPWGIASGDIDRDGDLDLAVGDFYYSSIDVHFGNPDGSFSPFSFATWGGTNYSDVALADLNRDGILDLIWPDYYYNPTGADALFVALGYGDGSFQGPGTASTVGDAPYSVAIADFNRDGKPDVASANYGSSNLSLKIGNGTGGFTSTTNYSTGTNPTDIASADFNGDTIPDVVTSNFNDDSVTVKLANATANGWVTSIDYPTAVTPSSVQVADMNADGKMDIVTTHFNADVVNILIGDGLGAFGTAAEYAMGTSPLAVALLDLNHDGRTDIVTIDQESSSVSIRSALPGAVAFAVTAPGTIASGVPANITVTALNACGGVATGYTGTVQFTSSDPLAEFPAGATFSASDNGVKVFPVTFGSSGNQTITATDVANGCITGSGVSSVQHFAKLQILLPGETAAPGTPTGKTGTPTGQTAGAAFTVTVNAVDPDWYPITAVTDTVAITSSDTYAILPPAAPLAGGTGTFSLTLNTAGSWTATATDSSNGAIVPDTSPAVSVGCGVTVKLQILVPGETAAPGSPTGKTGTPLAQTAGDPFTVTVNAVDTKWNPTYALADTVGITSSDPNAVLPANAPLNFGTRNFSVTLRTAGTSTLTATDISNPVMTANTSPAITVQAAAFAGLQILVPDETAAPGTPTGKTGTPAPQTAAVLFSVTVNAVDAFYNRVTTVTDTIHLASTDAAAVLPADTGLVAGTRTFTNAVSLRTVGSWTLTASDATDGGKAPDTSPSIDVSSGAFVKLQILVPGETAAPGTTYGKAGSPTAQTAGVPFDVIVNAVDAHWYLIDTVVDTVAITSSDANAVLPANAALVAGAQTFSVTLKTGGGRTVTATDATDGTKTPNTSPSISVAANAFTKLQILVPGEIAAPGTVTGKTGSPLTLNAGAAFTLTVNAVDDYWNKVASVTDTVHLTSTDTAAVLPADQALSGGTRTYTNAQEFRTVGTWTLTASDATDGLKAPNTSPPIDVVRGAFAKLLVLAPGETPAPGTANGKAGTPTPQTAGEPFNVTVYAVDVNWYLIDTVTDTVAITSSDTYAVLPPNAALSGGTGTFAVTLKTGGGRTVTASDVTNGSMGANTSSNITVVPNAFTKLQILVPGETAAPGSPTGKTGVPSARNAGAVFTITVNAVDDNWNKVGTVTDTVHLTSTDTAAVLPADQALAAGTRTYTNALEFRTPGDWTLTASDATDGLKAPDTSPLIPVVLGPFTKLQILAPGETASPGTTTGKTGTPTTQTAGVPFNITVNAVDANWYTVGTVTDTVAITTTDVNAVLPPNAPLTGGTGTFSVTLKTAGGWTATATDASNGSKEPNTSPSIPVTPNACTRLQILLPGETAAPGTPSGKTGTPAIQRAGTPLNPVVVNAVDDYWNKVASVTDTVHLSSSDPAAILPADAALTAGTRTYSGATLMTVGTWTLTATDVTDGGRLPCTSAPVSATTGPFVKLQVLAPGETAAPGTPTGKTGTPAAQTAGAGFTVTVNAVDSNWYPLAGITDTIGITASDAYAVLPSNAALVDGTQTFAVTLKGGPSRTVTATDLTDGAKTPGVSAAIPVQAAAFTKMQVLVPGETADPGSATGKTGTPTNANAAGAFNVTVSAVDDYWNPVPSVTDTIHIASTDGTALLPADAPLVAGTGTRSVTFNTAPGPFTLTLSDVDDGAKPSDTSPPIDVVAGAFTKLQILLPGETAAPGTPTGKTGTPSPQTAGVPFNITVNAVNANWYTIGSATDTVGITTGETNAILPADTPLAGGTVTLSVTMRTVGTWRLTATDLSDGTKAANQSPQFTVSAGPFSQLLVIVPGETFAPGTTTGRTGTPSNRLAGTTFSITVKSVDSCYNQISSSHNVHLTSTDPAAVLPANHTLSGGTYAFSAVELRTVGTWTITASDVTDGTKTPGTSSGIPVVLGAFTQLLVLAPGETPAPGTSTGKAGTPAAQTAGVPFSVTVYAVDANLYHIDTVTDTVAITSGDAYAELPPNAALSGGIGTFAVTLKTGGTRTVTASDVTDPAKTPNTSSGIPVNANEFTKLQILAPGETAASGSPTGKTGTPTAQRAGTAIITPGITVNAVDDYWNKVSTVTHTIHLSTADPLAAVPTDQPLAGGTRTYTGLILRTVGNWTVTAEDVTDPAKPSCTSADIPVTLGPCVKLQILVPGETANPGYTGGKTGSALAQMAGVPFDVIVNAVDSNWYPIDTVTDTVRLTSTDANAVLPPDAALTAGTGTFSVTLKTAGARTVTTSDITTPARTANTSPAITVARNEFTKLQILVPGETAAPGTPLGKTGSPTPRLAGAPFSVTVNAVDDYWNLVGNVTDTVHLSSTDPAAFLPADAALVGGTRTYTAPELRTVGTWTITVEDATDVSKLSQTSPPIPVTLGAFAKLQILVPGESPAPGTTTGKTGTPAEQTAGVPFNVVVNAVDANWFVINTVSDTVGITSSDANAVLPPDAALFAGSGTFSVTLKSGGARTITATDITTPAIAPNTSPAITVITNAFAKLQILVPGETAAPGTPTGKTGAPTARTAATAFTVIVNAVDEYWNRVTTVTDTVHLASTDPAAVLPADQALAAGTRTYTNLVKLRTVGDWTITVSDVTDAEIPSDTSPSIPVVLGPFSKLQILVPGESAAPGTATGKTGTPLPQTAGVPFTITVNAVDSNWYLINSATDTVGITSGDAYATLPSDAALVAGTQTFSVTLRTGGSRTVTATDLTNGAMLPNTSTGIPVGAASFVKLQILVPGETAAPGSPTGKTGTPTARTAGTGFTVTVNAVDEFWNRVNTVTDVVHLSSTDPAAVLPANQALAAGTRAYTNLVKLRTVGSWTITAEDATDPGKAPDTSPSIAVVLGSFTKLQVLAPGETAAPGTSTGKTGTPLPQTAGVPFTVTVNAVNANWYLIDSVTDTVHITSGDANAVLPADAALVGGTLPFSVTLKTGGSRTVTASDLTDPTKTSNTSTAIPVVAGAFTRLQILAPGETAAPGTVAGKTGTPTARTAGANFNVTVNAVDDLWNKVGSVTDTVHILSSDPRAILPANAALAAGTKAFAVTLRTAGTTTMTAQDVTDPAKPESTTPPLTVNPGAFAKLQILVPGETAAPGSATGKTGTPSAREAGVSFMIEVNAVDANWNRTTGVTDTVAITSTDAGAVLPPNTALAGGTQTLAVTLNTYGSQRLTASDVTTPARTPNTSPDIPVGSSLKLQILLPGETAAPGAPPGKTGTPSLLPAGVPFNVVVNAVDADWNILPAVTDTVALTSTDGSATLPSNTPLVAGTATLSMTFGTGGNFTVTASDVTDVYKAPDTSPSVTVVGEAGRAPASPLLWTGGGKDTLTWGAAINATSYNLYEGTRASLPDLLTGAVDSCRRWTGAGTTTGAALTQTPPADDLLWYVVTGVNSGVEGTPGNSTAGLRIVNSSGSCP